VIFDPIEEVIATLVLGVESFEFEAISSLAVVDPPLVANLFKAKGVVRKPSCEVI